MGERWGNNKKGMEVGGGGNEGGKRGNNRLERWGVFFFFSCF